MHNFSRAALAFARIAADANASDAERAAATEKLAAYCAKHNVTIADAAAAVANDSFTPSEKLRRAARGETATAKPAKPQPKPRADAKPKPEAEPVKPSKPADTSKAAAYAERVALIAALRASVANVYNGPSLAVRTNPKRFAHAVYAELLATPKHRTTLDRISVRDESGIREILLASANGTFDPTAINLDAGIFSRLASVGFIVAAGDAFALSDAGLAHARIVAKRAA